MTDEKLSPHQVPGPGQPLHSWDVEDSRVRMEFRMVLDHTQAETAVLKLVHGGEITTEDMVTFGHLNFAAFISGFEPAIALWKGSAKLDPRIVTWLSESA
ncbi:hypothetical protein J2Y69_002948 [Microbacterium resistens]|uniref:Uncharacterized protein n=1 Tax=Microbacterium resistens TaxID=156977 RepID=A0ABU1SFG5_9MICO|nr:hypothetical protein [Microbacterium resistens]MDR6868334.1 hypothetical protein [Microbacterium resistens]